MIGTINPSDAHAQAAQALRQIEQQRLAGVKAMSEACGSEFNPPRDMQNAAQIIRRLRADRDNAEARAKKHEAESSLVRQGIHSEVAALIAGKTASIKPDSPLLPLAAKIKQLLAACDELQEDHDRYRNAIRDTLLDAKLSEIPNLAGYFTSETPMQRAAEAGAVLVALHDKLSNPAMLASMRANYLRRRGWKLGANNTWIAMGLSLPVDSAVLKQVREDTKPFAAFGRMEWKGLAERACEETAKMPEPEPIDMKWNGIAGVPLHNETTVIAETRPIDTAAIRQPMQGSTAEVFALPRLS